MIYKHQSYFRGIWYERLCLDLENHLNNPKLALQKVELALQVETLSLKLTKNEDG